MAEALTQKKSTPRERWAWYLYDFGNSAYAAVVLLAIYSAYFQGTVVVGDEAKGSWLWGIAVGVAMLTVAVTAPVLGAIADFSGAKKKFLLFYTGLAVTFCGLLFFVQPGNVLIGMLFFILAEIGYRSAQVFYNSLLPEIADQDEIAKISGNGWAIGSLGGIVCLAIVLAMVILIGGTLIVRLSLVFTAIFFAISALPAFLWIDERAQPQRLPEGENYLSVAFKQLGETIRAVRSFREFVKFVIAFLIYNDGILMVLDYGAILGAVLFGMDQEQLIIFMIAVQVTSVIGAYAMGMFADRFGAKPTLIISLVMMVVPVLWLYFSYSFVEFYIIGGIAGFALTGVQSVSRAMVGLMAPEGQSAEFYGFFAVAGRTSSFIGPTVFGWAVLEATRWYERQGMEAELASDSGHRIALFTIIVFLLIGFVILLFVNEKKAREESAGGTA